MAKKKSTEQPTDETLGGLLEEPKPTDTDDDAGNEGEGNAAEPKGTVQVKEEGKPQAQEVLEAPAGQRRIRFKGTGKMKTVGERAAAQLVRLGRAEYAS